MPSELRTVLKTAGLLNADAARLVGVLDGRILRRWTSGESKIPYSAWAVLCEAAGFGRIWTFTTAPEGGNAVASSVDALM
jgi:hypothetical protein